MALVLPCPISTPRFVVRPVTADDLPDLLAVNGDDEVTRFLPYATWQNLDDAQAWLARMEALAATGTGRQLVVERRTDARVVGSLLVFRHDEVSARAELGYVIGRSHWRQGVAREAITAVCDAVFDGGALRRLEAEVNPDNLPSCRLLQSLGFQVEGRLRQRWTGKGRSYDTLLHGCLRDEWLARRRGAIDTDARSAVRRLTPADAEAYRTVMLEAYRDEPDAFTSTVAERAPLPLSWWAARIADAPDAIERVFGAFLDGQLVGLAGLSFEQHERTRHKALLFGMFVRPPFRGRGLARALVQAVLDAAAAHPGTRVVQLTVTDTNAPAIALYRSRGFVPFGVEPLAVRVPGRFVSKMHMSCNVGPTAVDDPDEADPHDVA